MNMTINKLMENVIVNYKPMDRQPIDAFKVKGGGAKMIVKQPLGTLYYCYDYFLLLYKN